MSELPAKRLTGCMSVFFIHQDPSQSAGGHADEVYSSLHPLHQTQWDKESPGLGGQSVRLLVFSGALIIFSVKIMMGGGGRGWGGYSTLLPKVEALWMTTMSPSHPVTQSPNYPVTQPPCLAATLSLSHPATELPFFLATLSPSHQTTLLPSHPTTLSPNHPVLQPPYRPVTLPLSYLVA